MRQRNLPPPLRTFKGAAARAAADAAERRSARSLMRVGDLARETGKTVRAIRLYEELGFRVRQTATVSVVGPAASPGAPA